MSTLEDRGGGDGDDNWHLLLTIVEDVVVESKAQGRTPAAIAAILSQSKPTITAAIEALSADGRAHYTYRDGVLTAWGGPVPPTRNRQWAAFNAQHGKPGGTGHGQG